MYDQINAARRNAGRGGLQFDTGIQYIAVGWSDEMSGSQTLRHNPSYGDQIVRHRDYRTAGENVGRGYEQGSLFQAFMNSPGSDPSTSGGALRSGVFGVAEVLQWTPPGALAALPGFVATGVRRRAAWWSPMTCHGCSGCPTPAPDTS